MRIFIQILVEFFHTILFIFQTKMKKNYAGTQQPGCGDDLVGQCGHSIASHFLSSSINPANIFGAIRCRGLDDIRQRNCVVSGTSRRMGGEPIMDGVGIVGSVYLLHTHAEYPYAQGPR